MSLRYCLERLARMVVVVVVVVVEVLEGGCAEGAGKEYCYSLVGLQVGEILDLLESRVCSL